LADMGIPPGTVAFLVQLGHDAVHLRDRGLERLPDPEVLGKAREEGRVLLTHDLDFGELVAARGDQLPSVVIFRLRDMRPDRVNRYLESVVTGYRDPLEEGAIVSVAEGQIRARQLPIQGGRRSP
jgi:predicted nuclease of predicted toxin-antitoxin system